MSAGTVHPNSFPSPPELPTPLAGHFVAPPVRTGASGHAWVSVDKHCHLHYEIVVAGLGKTEDLTVNAHLHGLAEIGELDDSSTTHKRLLTGFYGSQVGERTAPRGGFQTYKHTHLFLLLGSGARSVKGHQCGVTAAPGPGDGLHPGQHQDQPPGRNTRTGEFLSADTSVGGHIPNNTS